MNPICPRCGNGNGHYPWCDLSPPEDTPPAVLEPGTLVTIPRPGVFMVHGNGIGVKLERVGDPPTPLGRALLGEQEERRRIERERLAGRMSEEDAEARRDG